MDSLSLVRSASGSDGGNDQGIPGAGKAGSQPDRPRKSSLSPSAGLMGSKFFPGLAIKGRSTSATSTEKSTALDMLKKLGQGGL